MTDLYKNLISHTKVRFLSAVDLGIAFDDNEVLDTEIATYSFPLNNSLQKIYFGPPGSGKSRRVKEDTKGMKVLRTTFHPDSEYSSFVGSYKPVVLATGISYAFVPQIFTKAYVYAWKNPQELVCLVIEEINRGNCAQIFGDLFQLLDRNASGFSEYSLLADDDLVNHIDEKTIDKLTYNALVGGSDQLKLPPNLYLYATMNTSDQSLFPMDSAFKRRWDWEYVPIDYTDADQFTIELASELRYSWAAFIRAVNDKIYELNRSEDKQLGNRFVNPADGKISMTVFKSKVMFYLWSEIYKNETDSTDNIFITQPDPQKTDTKAFTFSELFEQNPDGTGRDLILLTGFMRQLEVKPLPAPDA